ncbi:hypothetical protein [Sandaracinus amylolyticus]|uniref:Lipoprotein n=1 Tax=Sandaracinus amylolyticus TaxID=927083 RepID=A0A0F6SEG1_9BACT|nr:hypothetical protein [Sandaracinus amylolyticus]AKF05134.1 hypothetical protein DB32_002283 [Sandaracinus amylolyticus]
MLLRRSIFSILLLLAACGESPGDDADAGIDASSPPPPPRDAGPALCPREGPLDAQVPLRSIDLCADGIVPSGLGLRWQRQAQFFAEAAISLDLTDNVPAGCPSGATIRGATLVSEASAGTLAVMPDVGVALFDYQVIAASDVPAPDGGAPTARTARGRATVELASGEASGEAIGLVDLAASGLAGASELVVAIDGFDLTTDLPQGSDYPPAWPADRGFAMRALGIEIVSATRDDDDTLAVRVRARFEPGELQRAVLYEGHDLASRVARRRAVVRFVVIASDVAPTRGSVAYRYASERSLPLEGGAPCGPTADETALALDGADGLAHGVAGITRFELAMWPDAERDGDLLREISVRLEDLAYDATSGTATMRARGYASNEGPLPRRGMDAQVEIDVALAQWSEGGEVRVLSVAAPIGEGPTEAALPME